MDDIHSHMVSPGEETTGCCRICCGDGDERDEENPLFSGVCRCRGTVDGVHARCLVKWQLMRRTNQWTCELCSSNIRWPADHTLRLVELLSELKEKTPPPPLRRPRQRRQRHADQLPPPPPETPPPPPSPTRPSTWARLKLGMSRSMCSVRKSVLRQTALADNGQSEETIA